LAAFVLWERRVARRPAGQALVDLALFRSAGFTWGTITATLVSFAMFGVLFAVPQYFQAVRGADALGAGVRLLPIIGGLLVGSRVGARLTPRVGARIVLAIGFMLLTAGLCAGAATGPRSGDGFAVAWIAVVGVGLGFALPAAMGSALGALSADRAGVGSALIMAVRQVGGTFGVAILGSILNAAYRSRVDVQGLPAATARTVRESVSAGVAVARRIESAPLLESARSSFIHGMDAMLWACGGVSALGIVLTLAFLPALRGGAAGQDAEQVELRHEGVA
jgi:predicted MFS family arabinose efflux permease